MSYFWAIFFSLIQLSSAKVIERINFKLEIPSHWNCQSRTGSSISCKHKQKKWLLVITDTEVNGPEELLLFKGQLQKKKVLKGAKGQSFASKILYNKFITLKFKKFIESYQTNSELPGYATYYLAGIIDTQGLLISISAPIKDKHQLTQEFGQLKGNLTFFK